MTDSASIIRLVPEGLTQGVALPDAFLLIMREEEGFRHLPLLVERAGYELLRRAVTKNEFPETRLMGKLAKMYDITLESATIRYARTGKFFVSLLFRQPKDEETDASNDRILNLEVAQGIAAAIEAHAPILMLRQEFDLLYSRQNGEGQVAVPITAMSGDLLKEALRQAVESENFELASQLRDELKSRE